MRGPWGAWVLVLTVAGCHAPPSLRPATTVGQLAATSANASPAAPAVDLPVIEPVIPVFDARGLPRVPPRVVTGPQGKVFRRLREQDSLMLSSANAPTTRLLDQENQLPPRPGTSAARAELWRGLRYHTALELRNRFSAEALERFLQLAELEARTDLLRQSFGILDALAAKAQAAKAANVRFPFDPADLARERSSLESQLEQAELNERLLNLDLKRRLGLTTLSADDRLWPVGDFTIDPTPLDPDAAVTAALADRPELRGLRQFQEGLTVETLPDARDLLHAGSPLLAAGSSADQPRLLLLIAAWCAAKKSGDRDKEEELAVRKQQLQDIIVERERIVADEARAAVLAANSQRVRAVLARDRVAAWEVKLAEAEKKRSAAQPGAEFLVPQVQLELLKARSELAAEVAAWHQSRIRIRAAEGWLVWEALSNAKGPDSGTGK